MHILLPPSEGKNAGGRRTTARIASAVGRQLSTDREPVLRALAQLCEQPNAAAALLLPDSVAATALQANREVPTGPTLPALQRYAGVVYDGLDVGRLDAAQRRLADRRILIFSGLFGVLLGAERIPAYRVPAKAVLPGIGVAATYWRPRLDAIMPQLLGGTGLIVDLRSTDYTAMWRPPRATVLARRLIPVRMLSTLPSGALGVISYNSKHAKGRLAAALVIRQTDGGGVRGVEDVLAAWAGIGGRGGRLTEAGELQLVE